MMEDENRRCSKVHFHFRRTIVIVLNYSNRFLATADDCWEENEE